MGMFDRVHFICPTCGKPLEQQSKAGDCSLTDYSNESIPMAIADDISHELIYCEVCKGTFSIEPPAKEPTVKLILKNIGNGTN